MYRVVLSSESPESKIAQSRVNNYHEELNQYLLENNGYHVDPMFGEVESNDVRFQQIFKDLVSLGYRPKETYYQSRFQITDAITIDVPEGTREVPNEVYDIVDKQPDIMIWDSTFHNTKAKNRKLKLSFRDSCVIEMRNEM